MTERAGLLLVSKEYGVARVRRALPPEHVIDAERPACLGDGIELLIRGPLLPEQAGAAEPPTVVIVGTMHEAAPGKGVKLTAVFREDTAARPDSAEWTIGEWPSLDAYRAEMDALSP